ncbi:hypothetical protein [Marisediminicola sp. LYQ134]|uniref:hypothetical protein n=1 Tax=Marisediminicola sp. LYQ134 TaxID=3391061 RepID=UPI003983A01A
MAELRQDGQHNYWVLIDVAAAAMQVSVRRARELAKSEEWRTAPGQRPTQYLFADIRRTYEHRKPDTNNRDTPSTSQH